MYYRIGSSGSYTSSTSSSKAISVASGTTVYYYGTPSSGYSMSSCTSSSPCNVTVTSATTKSLSASAATYTVQVKKSVDGGAATNVTTLNVASGGTASASLGSGAYYSFDSVSCTNGQTATVSESYSSNQVVSGTFTISNVTSNTVCTVSIST